MTLVMQGDQCAGEQERAGEGDGKAETGDRTEAERSRGDQHHDHDARLDLILSGISRPLINDSILLSDKIQVTSKEREETNPEFKRVLAERAKRLERVKIQCL